MKNPYQIDITLVPQPVIELRDLIIDRLTEAGFKKSDEDSGWDIVYDYPCQAKPSSCPNVSIIIHKGNGGVSPVGYYVYAAFRSISIGWNSGWNFNTPKKPKIKCEFNDYDGTSPDSIRLDLLDAWIQHQKELVTLFDKFDRDFKKLHTGKAVRHTSRSTT